MVGGLKGLFFALKSIKCLCQKNTYLVANVKKVPLEDVNVNRLKKARPQNFQVVLGNFILRYFLDLRNFNCFLFYELLGFLTNQANLQCFKHLGFFILQLLSKRVYRLKYCFSDHSAFLKMISSKFRIV